MSETQVRCAGWRDIPAMADVEQAAFPDDPWTTATLWAELALRPRRCYVVAAGGAGGGRTTLGYAGLDLAGDVADVMTVAVHPDARGRGLGGLLLERLHERARAAGATDMMLEVRADNSVGRRLYDTRGYRVVHTRRGYYRTVGGPPVDALVMRKELVGR